MSGVQVCSSHLLALPGLDLAQTRTPTSLPCCTCFRALLPILCVALPVPTGTGSTYMVMCLQYFADMQADIVFTGEPCPALCRAVVLSPALPCAVLEVAPCVCTCEGGVMMTLVWVQLASHARSWAQGALRPKEKGLRGAATGFTTGTADRQRLV